MSGLPRDSQALMVITRLRDEAHRFAITYHRNLREKTIRESVLDEIPGIGEAKKVALLKRFKSIYGIARATVADISAAAGVNETIAASSSVIMPSFGSQPYFFSNSAAYASFSYSAIRFSK